MRRRQQRDRLRFAVEDLEPRSLLSGGLNGHDFVHPGTLNPGFGNGGFVTSANLGPTGDTAAGVAIQRQSDGKIVEAGTASGTTSQSAFAVVRENADGSLDTTFGNEGTVHTEPGPGQILSATSMAIQPDGKILVAGLVEGTINNTLGEDFALVRYNANGSLDTSFGDGGEVFTDFGPSSFSVATSVNVTAGGKIVVAGPTANDGGDFALAEYNRDGSLVQSHAAYREKAGESRRQWRGAGRQLRGAIVGGNQT